MKTVPVLSAVLTLVAFSAGNALAQEFPPPGPEHEQLKKLAGEWDAQIQCKMVPEGVPQECTGEHSAKLEVGGFFLVSEFKAQMFGLAFQGRSLTGYDPFKKKYVGVWVDSMGPSIYNTEGSFDTSGNVYSETITGPDPEGKPMKMRTTTQIQDDDHLLFKMYAPGEDGQEMLLMETTYTRKK